MDNSGFGKLSAELRNQIYDQVLPDNRKILVYPAGLREPTKGYQPPIMQVCREMRADTIPMFYSRNKLVLPIATHDEDGEFWRELLENSVAQAEAWLRRNPFGRAPLEAPLIIAVNLDVQEWNERYRSRMPWWKLAKALKMHGYGEEEYVIEALLYYRPYTQPNPRLYEYNISDVPAFLSESQPKVEKTFRDWGMRCETHH